MYLIRETNKSNTIFHTYRKLKTAKFFFKIF